MMKNTFLKVLALVLALCFVLPLIVACNETPVETEAKTEANTKKPNPPKESETESDTETSTEEETNDRKEDSICFVGTSGMDELDPKARYFSSLEDAVAAYPDGAVILLCADVTLEEPFHFPEEGEFFMEFNGYDVKINFDAGVVLEYWSNGDDAVWVYSNKLSSILTAYKNSVTSRFSPKLWVFGETDGLAVGRYNIVYVNEEDKEAEPEYRYDYFEDLSNWGRKYVATATWDDKAHYFFTLQEAMDEAKSDNSYVVIHVTRNCEATDESGLLQLPYSSYSYRIPYDYHYVDGYFSRGITYDDGKYGYCFYSDLNYLSGQPNLTTNYCWIWSNEDGYVPGKYVISANVDNLNADADICDADGYYYVLHVGQYIYTRIEDASFDDFFKDMSEHVDEE